MCAQLLSRVRLLITPCTVAHQAPLSLEFSRQEHWSRLPFSSPVDPPDPGIEPRSPVSSALQVDSLPATPSGKPNYMFEIFGCIDKAVLTENFLSKLTITLLPCRLRQVNSLSTVWETKVQSLVGKIPGEGDGHPLQYSCLEHPMDREVWWATARGVIKELDTTQ